MIRAAEIEGPYRYELSRTWSEGLIKRVAFVMLNPSTADAEVDDPTIRRCIGFAKLWGFNALTVVNLFAYRATDPVDLERADRNRENVVGPKNLEALEKAVAESDEVIAAWGANMPALAPFYAGIVLGFCVKHGKALKCLGVTKTGAPKHPLYLPAMAERLPWRGYFPPGASAP